MSYFFSRLDSPAVPLVIVATAYLILILLRLSVLGYQPSYFVAAGDQYVDPGQAPRSLAVIKDSHGYDGQFYYRLALNPYTSERTEFGITLDYPQYRQQRILYPLIVWALSFGQADFVPVLMILVNYLSLCLLGLTAGYYAQAMKQHALWGVVPPLYPGFIVTLSLDLAEIVAVSFLLSSLLLVRWEKHGLARLLLTLAALAKETTLLVAVGALGALVVGAWRIRAVFQMKWHYGLVPLLAYGGWQLVLYFRWGELPAVAGSQNLGIPFTGLIDLFHHVVALPAPLQLEWVAELGFLLAFVVSALYALGSSIAGLHEKLSWLLYAGFMASLSGHLWWHSDLAFLRAFSEVYVLGWIILIGSPSKIKIPLLVCAMVLWLYLFRRAIY